jgi:ketosteroid isomerase-like protein
MIINAPDVLAELEAAFARYERALMDNDLDALHDMFWDSRLVIRFGPGQNLYGIDAIAAFRLARVGGSPRRVLFNTVITSFGQDFGTANTEFQREGTAAPGRQSQAWARLAPGWRIVAAHVSLLGTGS